MIGQPQIDCTASIPLLQELLGSATFLACKGKRPLQEGWNHLRPTDMTEEYLRGLAGRNIGVSLGAASAGLVSIDFDDDGAAESFLTHNPDLQNTLRTKGRRGFNIWIRVENPPPPTRLMNSAGASVGEWRSTGSQTIIAGIHPVSGEAYRFEVQSPAITYNANEIVWPPEVQPLKWAAAPSSRVSHVHSLETLDSEQETESAAPNYAKVAGCSVATENDITRALNALKAEKDFRSRQSKGVVRLYYQLVERTTFPASHERNAFIVGRVPFLFHCVHPDLVKVFSMQYYFVNRPLFNDSAHQHENETECMINACAETYLASLPENERQVYEYLDVTERAAFRIVRDLAGATLNKSCPPPIFFLSHKNLADRLQIHCQEASRIFTRFLRLNLLSLLQRGSKHTLGQPKKASRYRWNWSLPKPAEIAHGFAD